MDIKSFVLGLQAGKNAGGGSGGGDIVLPQQEYTFGLMDGMYICQLPKPGILLTVGNTYFVKWDNDPVCECIAISADGAVGVGNPALFGLGEDNGLPFLVGTDTTNGISMIVTASPEASHMVGIFGDMANEPVGASVEFVPDFSEGDFTILPSEGATISKVIVEKPETLIPENIANGVDIAGIIGTLAAGSGGEKNIVMKSANFKATAKTQTVTHNLGVVPDVAILFMMTTTSNSGVLVASVGYGEALHNALGGGSINRAYIVMAGGGSTSMGDTNSIENAGSNATTYGSFHDTTATTFTVGGTTIGLDVDKTYQYVLIGGLM